MSSLLSRWATTAWTTVTPDPVPEAKDVTPGWIAAVLLILLFVATLLLWLSLRKHLGRIRFDRPEEGGQSASTEDASAHGAPPEGTAGPR